jgi:hypothetical protein
VIAGWWRMTPLISQSPSKRSALRALLPAEEENAGAANPPQINTAITSFEVQECATGIAQ